MKILPFVDLHIGVENYGWVNPETGLNTRREDFMHSFDLIVEAALKEPVDLESFAGDTFQIYNPQILSQDLPVVYLGSFDRVDFSEEKEAKGYVLVELDLQRRSNLAPLQNDLLERAQGLWQELEIAGLT